MGKLRVLSRNGDDLTEWEAENEISADIAKELFLKHQQNGAAAFAKVGNSHKLIKTFDLDAEEILIVKPLVGG